MRLYGASQLLLVLWVFYECQEVWTYNPIKHQRLVCNLVEFWHVNYIMRDYQKSATRFLRLNCAYRERTQKRPCKDENDRMRRRIPSEDEQLIRFYWEIAQIANIGSIPTMRISALLTTLCGTLWNHFACFFTTNAGVFESGTKVMEIVVRGKELLLRTYVRPELMVVWKNSPRKQRNKPHLLWWFLAIDYVMQIICIICMWLVSHHLYHM